MKSCSKKGWKSLMPLRLSRSSTHFCMFPKVRSASQTSGNSPVYLNVYDLTPINGYMYWAGLGIYHTGVEVHGVEYAFGAHDYPSSGVFEVEPRQCPGFRFRKSIFMGTTCLDPLQLREFMELQSVNYNGDTYHLIMKNCNHFCKDICYKLTGNSIPKWVNRLAGIAYIQLVINQDCQARPEVVKIVNPTEFSEVVSIPDKSQGFKLARLKEGEVGQFGASLALGSTSNDSGCSLCNCLLPEALKITAVQHDPDSPSEDGEKRRLRSAFGCLSSISMRQRQFSASSLLLTSPFRGSLSHWDFRRSGAIPLKDT